MRSVGFWALVHRWWALCMLTWCGLVCLGCPRVVREEPQPSSSIWLKPKALPLYRGLMTGSSPAEVEREICRRWSLGRCLGMRLVRSRGVREGTRRFRYVLPEEPYPCQHTLTFQSWGLMRVEVSCKTNTRAQFLAVLSRYRRWYGVPVTFDLSDRRRYEWKGKRAENRKIVLDLMGSSFRVRHEDLRTIWLQEARSIEPVEAEVEPAVWKVWSQTSLDLRREVLGSLGRIVYLWRRRLMASSAGVLRSDERWTPAHQSSGCEPEVVKPGMWGSAPWSSLGFLPESPTRVHYRLRFLAPNWSRYPKGLSRRFSWLTSRRVRSIQLEVIGCGYLFVLEGSQNGRDIYFSRLKVKKSG